jgi:hypothetical protein
MHLPSVETAALNNAHWCDAVCRAHGLQTVMDNALWQCAQATPRFYPNAVTLDAHAQAQQLAQISALDNYGLAGGLSVKDSFATLDLAPLGYTVRFEATWIACAPIEDAGRPSPLRWSVVRTPAALQVWESAWGQDEAAPAHVTFPAALLRDPAIFILAARRGRDFVAGGILNRSDTRQGKVVGLSNAFALAGEDAAMCWVALAGLAAQVAPGCALVGYEAGAALEWAAAAGFTPLHTLRIWARDAQS